MSVGGFCHAPWGTGGGGDGGGGGGGGGGGDGGWWSGGTFVDVLTMTVFPMVDLSFFLCYLHIPLLLTVSTDGGGGGGDGGGGDGGGDGGKTNDCLFLHCFSLILLILMFIFL